MNTHANEKCEACSAWEQETGYGKVCTHTPANEEPIKDLPDFLNRLMETPTPTHEWRGEVTLAPEGTLLAIFQQERTDAISEMFDNEDEDGLFETSKFFARLDKCVENLLNQHSAHLVESGKYNSDKLWGEGYYKGIMDERNRIEEVFKKEVPPHAMDIEDSVWLKRLLNKAFNHDKNI